MATRTLVDAIEGFVRAMETMEDPLRTLIREIESGLTGTPTELRELQRHLALLSRDTSVAACALFTRIKLAESEEAFGKGSPPDDL